MDNKAIFEDAAGQHLEKVEHGESAQRVQLTEDDVITTLEMLFHQF